VRDLPRPSETSAPAPAPSASASSAGKTTDDRSTAFRPVVGGNELQSGEKLLVEAYAAIWLILFALVLLSWRRQRGMDERMNTLEGAIAKARADREADEAGARKGSA
jgi:hypothetical protein